MCFRDLFLLVIAVLVCRGESQSLSRYPPGALMVSGIIPQGTIYRNKGYLSGWTRVPPEGPFYAKCCSSMEYTYSDNSCVTRVRTPEFSGSGLPSYYFPVGGITLRPIMGLYDHCGNTFGYSGQTHRDIPIQN